MASSKRKKSLAARAAKKAAARANQGGGSATETPLDPPYGYAREGEGDEAKLVPVEAELEVIAQIRELSEKRLSLKKIAEKLATDELDCRGTPWSVKRVTTILRRNFDNGMISGKR